MFFVGCIFKIVVGARCMSWLIGSVKQETPPNGLFTESKADEAGDTEGVA